MNSFGGFNSNLAYKSEHFQCAPGAVRDDFNIPAFIPPADSPLAAHIALVPKPNPVLAKQNTAPDAPFVSPFSVNAVKNEAEPPLHTRDQTGSRDQRYNPKPVRAIEKGIPELLQEITSTALQPKDEVNEGVENQTEIVHKGAGPHSDRDQTNPFKFNNQKDPVQVENTRNKPAATIDTTFSRTTSRPSYKVSTAGITVTLDGKSKLFPYESQDGQRLIELYTDWRQAVKFRERMQDARRTGWRGNEIFSAANRKNIVQLRRELEDAMRELMQDV